ncbi:MAG: BCCT family transporter [Candidatus Melainabacteria bacterium]|nr:BCCT family transporter [Candidatus Melainabacteria bacterium]
MFLVGMVAILACCFGSDFYSVLCQFNQLSLSSFSPFYLILVSFILVIFVGLGFSPLGNIRFGGKHAKPEFSWLSWFAMLFSAGMGSGMLFWGAAEPLYHFNHPPLQGTEGTLAQALTAMHLTFFHWGVHPWAIYGLTATTLAFWGFNLKRGFHVGTVLLKQPRLNATATEINRFGRPLLYAGVEQLTVIAILFGVSASFAMSVLQLEAGFHTLLGWSPSGLWHLFWVALFAISFLMSAINGLHRGIRLLSYWGMIGSVLLMCSVCVYGEKLNFSVPFVQSLLQSLPVFAGSLPSLSMGLASFTDPLWVQQWTVKYWSWWIAWTPFVGIFIALISKGRSIRELMLASLLAPSLFSFLWFFILGESAIALQIQQGNGLAVDDNVQQVLFHLLASIPQVPLLSVLAMGLMALFFINSADSATYTLAYLSVPQATISTVPPGILQIAWGLLIALLTLLFLWMGGVPLMQEVTLLPVLPFAMWLVVVFGFTLRAMWLYYKRSSNGTIPHKR